MSPKGKFVLWMTAVVVMGLSVLILQGEFSDNERTLAMNPKTTSQSSTRSDSIGEYRRATFAAGCFWGVEATLRKVNGVVSATVGYTGGTTKNPTYEDVCAGDTGHAEAVEVVYDPKRVSYEALLDVFWDSHDPTTLNRQGPDVGYQYRSAIFYHSPEQETAARASKEKLERSGRFKRPIVTQITPATDFYRAEEYHQRYLEKHGRAACPSH